ncbi:MAG: hypothetical protein Q6373_025500 [Candidatus Sigynarchaeota archaeon]
MLDPLQRQQLQGLEASFQTWARSILKWLIISMLVSLTLVVIAAIFDNFDIVFPFLISG